MTAFLVRSLLLALGVCASTLSAQTAACDSLNDSTSNVANFISSRNSTRPNSWGWRYVPSSVKLARGLRIYTGNAFTTGFMQLEVWDEDSTTLMPGKRLAGGTFYAPKSSTGEWLGTNLDRNLVLQPNTPYWFVWVEIGWSVFPTEPGGTSMPAAARWDGAMWVASTTNQLKFRLYCSFIDTKGAVVAGTACTGAASGIGTAFSNLTPNIGNADYRVEGSGLPSGAPTLILLGAVANFPSVPLGSAAPGCFLNTDIVFTIAGITGNGDVRTPAAAGHLFAPLPIPNNPVLVGTYVGMQFAALDSASQNALPFVLTNAVRTTVF